MRIENNKNEVVCQTKKTIQCNALMKRGPKPLGLPPPQTELLKTLESGFIEIIIGIAPYHRFIFTKSLFSIWVN